MTSTRGEQDFAQVWLAFVQAIRQLLEMMYAQQDREYLEPYRGGVARCSNRSRGSSSSAGW
jgi:hypothetical protein